MNQDINRELLFLYWSGLATPMQRKLIVEWLQESAHQETFYQWLTEWEDLYPQSLGDTDKAWVALSSRVDGEAAQSAPAETQSSRPLPVWRPLAGWWMMAASFVLIMGVSFLLRDTLFWNTYRTGSGQIATIQLADGSQATLNANSELRAPIYFLPFGDRSIQLTGEADFSVTHQKNHQRFIVKTPSNVDVVVLGTEFVIRSTGKQFRVALHTGKIALKQDTSRTDKPLMTLKPGDVASIDTGGALQLATRQPTRQLTTWRNRLFVFDHHSLGDVLTMLNDQFGETIKLENDSLANYQITGRFRAERAEDLLAVITEITGYRIVTRNNQKYLVN
ncbi:FecR family protein [Spirosoma sp. 209]|uniref:FecR family protein n=1 Tax=Spirosoma sp. 209 TaxID=1955701 RepID=UPI00098D04B0|nr:FecR domain-containing protein [Spirosoma sp. 209]